MKKSELYEFQIELEGIAPPIFRHVLVPSSITFAKFHRVIQLSMGWQDSHLHRFVSDSGGPMKAAHEKTLRLSDAAAKRGPGARFRYEYDTGDGWVHFVVLVKVVDASPSPGFFACTGGARACPPEDCGGPHGYAELLEILADPGHPERDERLGWLGGPFDPEAFDREAVTKRLKRLRL